MKAPFLDRRTEQNAPFAPVPAGTYRIWQLASYEKDINPENPKLHGELSITAISVLDQRIVAQDGMFISTPVKSSYPDPQGRGTIVVTPHSTYLLEPVKDEQKSAENPDGEPECLIERVKRVVRKIVQRNG